MEISHFPMINEASIVFEKIFWIFLGLLMILAIAKNFTISNKSKNINAIKMKAKLEKLADNACKSND